MSLAVGLVVAALATGAAAVKPPSPTKGGSKPPRTTTTTSAVTTSSTSSTTTTTLAPLTWPSPAAAPVGAMASARFPNDAPDPFVLSVDPSWCASGGVTPSACYFAYTTQVYLTPLPVWRSTDLVNWTDAGGAMPNLATWVEWGNNWAPSVIERPNNPSTARFVMWYTARRAGTTTQCIGVATSSSPTGPFVDSGSSPAKCQTALGGTIDPSPFVDADGTVYLTYKSESPARLYISRLSSSALSFANSTETLLLNGGGSPDASVIEAPTMMRVDRRIYLFYSTDSWWTSSYRLGVAHCDTPTGPCTRLYTTSVLANRSDPVNGPMLGPGGQTPFQDRAGNWKMVFHSWTAPNVDYPNGGVRTLHILSTTFNADGSVKIG